MSDIREASFWQKLLEKILKILGKGLSNKRRKPSEKHQHVVPYKKGWAVRGEGNKRITSKHRKQSTAIRKARTIARRYKSDVVVHGSDGRIRDRMSYD
ncbi:MAG: DUF2188 domain-containing protein [Flavobacteriales bacterium]|nr:DUF2188 domain-containing protein [Flavobacteriales bacterium]